MDEVDMLGPTLVKHQSCLMGLASIVTQLGRCAVDMVSVPDDSRKLRFEPFYNDLAADNIIDAREAGPTR
jgi:hypothetical protein